MSRLFKEHHLIQHTSFFLIKGPKVHVLLCQGAQPELRSEFAKDFKSRQLMTSYGVTLLGSPRVTPFMATPLVRV